MLMRCHRCHLAARLSTAAAHFRAGSHLSIIPKAFTVFRTTSTDLSTNSAGQMVLVRTAQHVVGTCLTNFRTVQQQCDMTLLGMFVAHLETVSDCRNTDIMTICTGLNSSLHFLRHLVHGWLLLLILLPIV